MPKYVPHRRGPSNSKLDHITMPMGTPDTLDIGVLWTLGVAPTWTCWARKMEQGGDYGEVCVAFLRPPKAGGEARSYRKGQNAKGAEQPSMKPFISLAFGPRNSATRGMQHELVRGRKSLTKRSQPGHREPPKTSP